MDRRACPPHPVCAAKPSADIASGVISCILLWQHKFDRVETVAGEQVRNVTDFASAAAVVRVDGNKGRFHRRPKASAYLLRRRWRGQPGRHNSTYPRTTYQRDSMTQAIGIVNRPDTTTAGLWCLTLVRGEASFSGAGRPSGLPALVDRGHAAGMAGQLRVREVSDDEGNRLKRIVR